ncbi:site-specific DNA-methyltransferase [Rhizobium lusitanum]|uniref:site-specific DNA-methyltransferase n=1 Tax=Rhizobium lusitanum TaxID=293958 RepID=UPI0032B2B562
MSIQKSIQLPLFEVLEEVGGRARPSEVYERVADAIGIGEKSRQETRTCGDGQSYRVFDQQVRWARQTAVAEGLIAGDRGIWELTDSAYLKLGKIRRGAVVLIYTTGDGFALWAHAEDAASYIDDGSVQLLMTSPPYPVVNREYGRFTVEEWLRWMRHCMGIWKSLVASGGTIAVNLMDVFVQGTPMLSPYVERFTLSSIDDVGLHFAGRMMWYSPTKLGNIEWTAKRKVHPRNKLEHVLLFSKAPRPSWDITRIEMPVKSSSGRKVKRDTIRPSGMDICESAFVSGQGLPSNLIIAGGASGNDTYSRRARDVGIGRHPARFPEAIPRRIIQLATAPGDICYDPMAGSNTTGKVASELGRRFIASEPMLEYVRASSLRFSHRSDFRLKEEIGDVVGSQAQ